MSHQPSTLDNVRSTAANATQAIADSLDPAEETQANKGGIIADKKVQSVEKGSYKDQLNEAANGNLKAQQNTGTVVEKIATYIPGLSTVLGTSSQPGRTETGIIDDGKPPQRPEHDVQVSEFIKEQYKSKSGSDMPDVGE